MQTESVEEVGRPVGSLTGAKLTTVTLHEQALESPVHIVIGLPTLDGGMAGAARARPSRATSD